MHQSKRNSNDPVTQSGSKYFFLKQDEKERLQNLKDMLQQNLDKSFTIPELAKKIFINEFKLKKGFKLMFGKSIYAFHFELKMQYACLALKETDLNLEEIAKLVGFRYVTSFIAAFRKVYKTTPHAYRRENR